MRAHQIMTRSVIAVTPGTPVAEAARIMLHNHIGGLPVVDASGTLVGMVTDGDFLRRAELGTERRQGRWLDLLVGRGRIGADFVHSHGRTVGDIMSQPPVTVSADASLAEIAEIMEKRNIKRLPVMSGDRLAGVVTHTDFLQTVADLATAVPGPTPDDDGIRSAILDSLDQAACKHGRFNVVVRNGIARLTGAVRNEKERATAIVAAKSVQGVRSVRDHMWVYPPPEDEFGGGDIVSLQDQPSTDDDQPL
ncbi:CBS domain-containing protein [Bradyrhizobium sp. HKCCYLRH3061]|uniref:CBS domain-containing protein n=1 Tax=Bradyrhizobium sp. HKCCYLRH3061 TaxID=3420734 RepID=UPI003EBFB6EC